MKPTVSLRLPPHIANAVDSRAEALGITPSDLIADALAQHLHLARDPAVACAIELGGFIADRYSPASFPTDVTLQGFRFVQFDATARRYYDQAITGPDGVVDEDKRAHLHRLLGRTIKQRLKAKVVGRSAPLDPAIELIASHALLAPQQGE